MTIRIARYSINISGKNRPFSQYRFVCSSSSLPKCRPTNTVRSRNISNIIQFINFWFNRKKYRWYNRSNLSDSNRLDLNILLMISETECCFDCLIQQSCSHRSSNELPSHFNSFSVCKVLGLFNSHTPSSTDRNLSSERFLSRSFTKRLCDPSPSLSLLRFVSASCGSLYSILPRSSASQHERFLQSYMSFFVAASGLTEFDLPVAFFVITNMISLVWTPGLVSCWIILIVDVTTTDFTPFSSPWRWISSKTIRHSCYISVLLLKQHTSHIQ